MISWVRMLQEPRETSGHRGICSGRRCTTSGRCLGQTLDGSIARVRRIVPRLKGSGSPSSRSRLLTSRHQRCSVREPRSGPSRRRADPGVVYLLPLNSAPSASRHLQTTSRNSGNQATLERIQDPSTKHPGWDDYRAPILLVRVSSSVIPERSCLQDLPQRDSHRRGQHSRSHSPLQQGRSDCPRECPTCTP